MSIKAERFKTLDKDSNIPTLDILNIKNSDVYNSAKDAIKSVSTTAENFLKSPKLKELSKVKKEIDRTTDRLSKDINGNLKDVTKLSTKNVDKLITDLFPDNSIVKSMVGQLTDKCKNSALGSNEIGKPFDSTVNCNGKDKVSPKDNCSASQISNILNKLTGGSYNASFNNLNDAYKTLVALSKLGYSANMCGVFEALTATLVNKKIIGKAANSLLGHISASKNIAAMIDMSNKASEINMSQGAKLMLNNFKIPAEVKETNYVEFLESVCNAATEYNVEWDSSELDQILSIAILRDYNTEMDKIMDSRRMQNVFSPVQLFQAVNDDCDFMSVAYKLKKEQNSNFKVFA